MKRTTKIAAGVLALSLAAAGIAVAQQAPGGPEGGFRFGRGTPASPEMLGRMLDGKIAGAKAALKLTAEQEKLWPAVEQAVRDGAAKRMKAGAERRVQMDEMRKAGKRPDMLEMLDRGSQRTAEWSADMKKFAEVLRPLYATLSDEQKQVLAYALKPARMGEGGGGRWGGHRGRMGG